MQAQDVSGDFIVKAWPWFEANKTRLAIAVVVLAVFIGIISYVSSQRSQKEVAAGESLSQLLTIPSVTPDQLLQFASTQSGTQAAERARIQAGLAFFEAGNYSQAEDTFQKFADEHSTSPLAASAILGEGASLEAQGKADLAVNAYTKVVTASPDGPNALIANFSLGRISEQQGKLTAAQNYFQEVVRHGNQLSLANEAYQHLEAIHQKLAAVKPAAK